MSRKRAYTFIMSLHVIQNPVPTPEQMADILGVSRERLAAVRRIMSEPVRRKPSRSSRTVNLNKKNVSCKDRSFQSETCLERDGLNLFL